MILPQILAVAALATLPISAAGPPAWALPLLDEVRHRSFPELSRVAIDIRPLRSRSDFFEARPRLTDFFRPHPMRYLLFVNERAGTIAASDPGAVEAILAHELEHIRYYTQRGKRWRMLGLVRLLRSRSEARWERATDERTIALGYGRGLIRYREWLYRTLDRKTAERKRRLYLTPEEIAQRLRGTRRDAPAAGERSR